MKSFSRLFLTAVIALGLCVFFGCGASEQSGEPAVESSGAKALPKLLDLGAKKCVPCRKMAPILEELTEEYKGVFEVEFVDVWLPENKERAARHGVRAIPTQIFFDAEGKELWRHEGFISKDDILKKWSELGYDFRRKG